jgi:phage terminase large subunit-like protein
MVCHFAELMKHEKGSLQGQRFKLEDWQIFILCNIFGFADDDGIRRFREAFILVPRGNGKSPLAAIIALWMAFFDGEPGAEVYCGANTERQAWEVFRPAKAFVEQVEELTTRFGIEATAKSIYQALTRSRFQPVVGRPGDGASVYCGILDEFHESEDAELYDTFKTGANKRKNSLILIISTAGITTEGPCHRRQKDVSEVLDGTVENDRIFGITYGVDEDTDWTSRDALVMANPNLGISNVEESLIDDQKEAVRNPQKQNIFRTKHLNVWCSSTQQWLRDVAWSKCYDPEFTEESVKHLNCWLGSDLASKIDFSATVRLFRDDSQGDKPHYYCLARTYLPEVRVNLPENQHYQGWVHKGWITATPDSSMDYSVIERDALADAATFKTQELCYDQRYADQFSLRVSEQAGIPRVVVPPSPAELSPAMKELEAAIEDGRFHHNNNPVLTWCLRNVMTRETSAGNYTMPDKQRPENKIDAAIALFIAMRRAMLMPTESSYFEPLFL